MIPLAKLKQNLELNKDLGGIIEALKMAASIQLRQFQSKNVYGDRFLRQLVECARILQKNDVKHFLLSGDNDLPLCIVGISSDEGFLGELNTSVVNMVLEDAARNPGGLVVILGERGSEYLRDMGHEGIFFPGLSDELGPHEVAKLKEYLWQGYSGRRFGGVEIVYPEFVSVVSQRVRSQKILPYSFAAPSHPLSLAGEVLLEPDAYAVVEGVLTLWLESILTRILFSSKLSEFSARFMHLDSSEQELRQVNQRLKLQYFRYLHNIADKTIREISASRFVRKN